MLPSAIYSCHRHGPLAHRTGSPFARLVPGPRARSGMAGSVALQDTSGPPCGIKVDHESSKLSFQILGCSNLPTLVSVTGIKSKEARCEIISTHPRNKSSRARGSHLGFSYIVVSVCGSTVTAACAPLLPWMVSAVQESHGGLVVWLVPSSKCIMGTPRELGGSWVSRGITLLFARSEETNVGDG